ncbi:MAG TPA: HAMP domain-containing sensor histidine kinase, partial [Vicinamibacterales bacterium]|nr:HAMP domain-containing sensor histidine kinase [Vicinamibacterales bacterium]
SSVVMMARRVLDELGAAQTLVGQPRPAPDDNAMVLIRQVVDQDVNLFEGPSLLATSQRDLFESGFLPTRTPAEAYRQIALGRRPVFVTEDRLGTFSYLVAAAPVPAFGRDMIITVPLASRQRDIERQTDDLTQGVLTGAVLLVLFAAALGAYVAARVSDPVARLTRATRLVAAGRFDERLAADTADELGRLVQDFNTMTRMLAAQRAELARANQVQAWAEMARQVAHEIKNPLTPIQLAAEHLQRVHDDARRPLGTVVDQCLTTILTQVRLLRQIASEFSTFAGAPTPRIERLDVAGLVRAVVEPYLAAPPNGTEIRTAVPSNLPSIRGDRTLLSRALTNLVENALQAMPSGGRLRIEANADDAHVEIRVIDTGVGMDEEGVRRAFEPYFSTKTGGSGLGLANAKRNIELCGGEVTLTSQPREGTTVAVRLPVADPGAHARA